MEQETHPYSHWFDRGFERFLSRHPCILQACNLIESVLFGPIHSPPTHYRKRLQKKPQKSKGVQSRKWCTQSIFSTPIVSVSNFKACVLTNDDASSWNHLGHDGITSSAINDNTDTKGTPPIAEIANNVFDSKGLDWDAFVRMIFNPFTYSDEPQLQAGPCHKVVVNHNTSAISSYFKGDLKDGEDIKSDIQHKPESITDDLRDLFDGRQSRMGHRPDEDDKFEGDDDVSSQNDNILHNDGNSIVGCWKSVRQPTGSVFTLTSDCRPPSELSFEGNGRKETSNNTSSVNSTHLRQVREAGIRKLSKQSTKDLRTLQYGRRSQSKHLPTLSMIVEETEEEDDLARNRSSTKHEEQKLAQKSTIQIQTTQPQPSSLELLPELSSSGVQTDLSTVTRVISLTGEGKNKLAGYKLHRVAALILKLCRRKNH
jgi:hypothetical protein